MTAPQVYDVFTSGRAADGNHAQVFGSSLEDGLNRAEQDSLLGLAEHQAGAAMNGLRGPASADQIQRQEAPLAEAIAGTVWPGQRIVVASARFSTVAVALAARGLNVVEAIFDAARAAVAKAAVDAINRESARGRPQFEVEFTATGGLAEFAWRRYASTVVFADCSMGLGDEEVAQLLATLARVPLIVLDPDRFFRRRVAADRPALARMIMSAAIALNWGREKSAIRASHDSCASTARSSEAD